MTKTSASATEHAGAWVLADHQLQVLAVGDQQYRGHSPRVLDATARQILVPRMRATVLDGIQRTSKVQYDGRDWTATVIPVSGAFPSAERVLAVLGCYLPAGEPVPSPPLVGSWEWQVLPPGAGQGRRTYWSPWLFDVYGRARPAPSDPDAPPYWEAPEWLDRAIAPADRPEMLTMLDAFMAATTDRLFLHSYHVLDEQGQPHPVRFAGRSYVTDRAEPRWFRGITWRVPVVSDRDRYTPTHAWLDAVLALSPAPLCGVETDYEQINMSTSKFADLGIWLPPSRHLPEMVHPDDLDRFRTFLHTAAHRHEDSSDGVRVRLATVETPDRHTSDHWRPLHFCGLGVSLSRRDPHQVLCKVVPA